MSCPAITKFGSICNNAVKKYGVCEKHRSWSYKGPSEVQHPEISNYVKTQAELMRRNREAMRRYEDRTGNGSDIQAPWRGNLCNVLTPEEIEAIEDPDVREFALTLEESRANIERAKEYMDPYLACNLAIGVNDYINDPNTQVPLRVLCIEGARAYLD